MHLAWGILYIFFCYDDAEFANENMYICARRRRPERAEGWAPVRSIFGRVFWPSGGSKLKWLKLAVSGHHLETYHLIHVKLRVYTHWVRLPNDHILWDTCVIFCVFGHQISFFQEWLSRQRYMGFLQSLLLNPGVGCPKTKPCTSLRGRHQPRIQANLLVLWTAPVSPTTSITAAHSHKRADYPAWAVDLGYPMHVAMVKVTNRECTFNWDIIYPCPRCWFWRISPYKNSHKMLFFCGLHICFWSRFLCQTYDTSCNQ